MSSYGATRSNARDAEAGLRGTPSEAAPSSGSETQATTPLLQSRDGSRAAPPRSSSVRTDFGDESRAKAATKAKAADFDDPTTRKYIFAGCFLVFCLVGFVVQTEVSVYIQRELHWEKPYCMLWLTHSSWFLIWPVQLIILRIRKWHMPWTLFWRRHATLLYTTAQMVETGELHLSRRPIPRNSPYPCLIRRVAWVTCILTVAATSWYVAVTLTTPSDLTAIYNCSAFFAYAFSIPLLNDKLRFDKLFSVVVAVAGVLIVAYIPSSSSPPSSPSTQIPEGDGMNLRALGNIIIGIGSILYGLYEVLYKRYACPPDGTSPGRCIIFANTVTSMIGFFTFAFLWVPLPILHVLGIETISIPSAETVVCLLVSTSCNAIFAASFLVLVTLTSPVLSSVASLLTIFLVAIVDWMIQHVLLSKASIIGGSLITVAFLLLSWSTYREAQEERAKRLAELGPDPEDDDDDDEMSGMNGIYDGQNH